MPGPFWSLVDFLHPQIGLVRGRYARKAVVRDSWELLLLSLSFHHSEAVYSRKILAWLQPC